MGPPRGRRSGFVAGASPRRPLRTWRAARWKLEWFGRTIESTTASSSVDDEPNILDLVSMALRYQGFEVASAATGQNALQQVTAFRPHLMILDVGLPDMEGFEVAERLGAQRADVPIVSLTARDATPDKVRGLTAGGRRLRHQAVQPRGARRPDQGHPPPRRAAGPEGHRLVFEDLEMDDDTREVTPHELRTPLASIRGYAELFRMGAARDEAESERAMLRIEQEAARMGVLVDDLLLLARVDEVRESPREPVDLAEVARDAVADARATAPDRTIALTLGASQTVVLGDENGCAKSSATSCATRSSKPRRAPTWRSRSAGKAHACDSRSATGARGSRCRIRTSCSSGSGERSEAAAPASAWRS